MFSDAEPVRYKSVLDGYKKCQMDSVCQTVIQPLHGYTSVLLATNFKRGATKNPNTETTHSKQDLTLIGQSLFACVEVQLIRGSSSNSLNL